MRCLPTPRGELSTALVEALRAGPSERLGLPAAPCEARDPLVDEDLQLALYVCYELHYRGFADVDSRWEWSPSLLAFRGELERIFEDALLEAVPQEADDVEAEEVDLALREISEQEGPPLSGFIRTKATLPQVLEFMVHRSAYQLKEADPHSWAIPRLWGPPKAAMIEIQADEYGAGRADWIHAELFARSMKAVGLDPSYGFYLDLIPGVTLATVNLMSLFGLHRRLRGALVGHLALFEMTSSIPNRRYADGLRRLGFGADATLFFDEHVEADAVHENVASVDLAGGLVRQDRTMAGPVLWGARALAHVDRQWAGAVLECWRADRSSLRSGLEPRGGRLESGELVRSVAEGADAGLAAPA